MNKAEFEQWVATDGLYRKGCSIIDSCETLVQLDTATNYVGLIAKQMHYLLGPSLLHLMLSNITYKRTEIYDNP